MPTHIFFDEDGNQWKVSMLAYWPAVVAIFTVLIGAVFDPKEPVELLPPRLDIGRAPDMLLSPWLWLCAVVTNALLYNSHKTAVKYRVSAMEHFAMIWWSLNIGWFQTGCDVLSGLFAVMPNLSECYTKLNRDHEQPMFSDDRVLMDVIYWFELLIEVPLGLWCLQLYFTRSPRRYVVEIFTCGMHVGGCIAYYVPDLVLGWLDRHESTSVITWLDRAIATLWLIVPCIMLHRALTMSDTGAGSPPQRRARSQGPKDQ